VRRGQALVIRQDSAFNSIEDQGGEYDGPESAASRSRICGIFTIDLSLERNRTVMRITSSAADMIREWLRRSVIVHPTVCLIQASDTPREIEQAINRGASRTEIEEIFLKESVKETKYLYPAVYPRSHFLWVFTTTIDGFRFAVAVGMPVA
jgi:hypothetical protein